MSGADIQADVHAALLEVGQETGTGEFTVQFLRSGAVDESTYPPTLGADTTFTARAMQSMIKDSDKDGENIRDGDIMLTVTPFSPNEPSIGDRVSVGGRTYSLQHVEPVSYAGVPLSYKVRARGAGPTT